VRVDSEESALLCHAPLSFMWNWPNHVCSACEEQGGKRKWVILIFYLVETNETISQKKGSGGDNVRTCSLGGHAREDLMRLWIREASTRNRSDPR